MKHCILTNIKLLISNIRAFVANSNLEICLKWLNMAFWFANLMFLRPLQEQGSF